MQEKNPVKEFVEANDNRVTYDEAVDEFTGRVSEDRVDDYIQAWIDECDNLKTDRFGGKDRIEKVVY